jgi:hypothetical protein
MLEAMVLLLLVKVLALVEEQVLLVETLMVRLVEWAVMELHLI